MLGVGLGEPPDADFADFGDEPDPIIRAARLDEGLAVLDEYLDGVDPPSDWDLFASLTPGYDPSEFAAVGVTWLVDSAWPVGDWVAELSGRITEGPPR
jgi:hypothetical protein